MADDLLFPIEVVCTPDERKRVATPAHAVAAPAVDEALQTVYRWLVAPERNVVERLVLATDAAIKYVLDGARTRRLSLDESAVDKDERSSVGTKLQYHIIEQLELQKQAPLDTIIEGIPVELKTTVRSTWTIPVEGQCEVTLLVQADIENHRVAAWLIRTHRVWLNDGTNQDKKRTIKKENFTRHALPIVPWTSLPGEPLRSLTEEDRAFVLGSAGIRWRIAHLLSVLPNIVIPRTSIAIVGGTAADYMKRAREAKSEIAPEGLLALVGSWPSQRLMARALGFDLVDEAWVAVSVEHVGKFVQRGALPVLLDHGRKTDRDFLILFDRLPEEVRLVWGKVFPDLLIRPDDAGR